MGISLKMVTMRPYLSLYVFLLVVPLMVRAQDHAHEEEHVEEHHSHYRNEVAMSNNLVFLGKDKEFAFGIHLHYLRNIGVSKFGAGLGYERIFDEHGHNTVSLAGSYRPFHELVFMVSPGITFDDQGEKHLDFSMHLEAGYEFEIKHIHIGPVLGVAFIPGDYHLSLGLHLGYGF